MTYVALLIKLVHDNHELGIVVFKFGSRNNLDSKRNR